MSIQLHCPRCGKLIKAPDNAGGKHGKCPYCKESVYVPMPADEVEEIGLAPVDEEAERRAEEERRASLDYVTSVSQGRDTRTTDDSARILIARRLASNWGTPQFDQPGEAEYTTAWTSGQARLRLHWDTDAYVRPWKRALVVDVREGALWPGDVVKITFGDTTGGGPGSRSQTFREETYEFRVVVDPFGNGVFEVVQDLPELRIIGGPAERLVVRAPSEVVIHLYKHTIHTSSR